ncbi:hypothetical protein [uncultured Ruminococcus sp.]|uniref:hypothetical protein n=1 Tax=Ruminococcus sp. TaxID=41978 RepID=UPI0026388A27|nr:hypothetical protein [uncultured Ruminococcus sp.]
MLAGKQAVNNTQDNIGTIKTCLFILDTPFRHFLASLHKIVTVLPFEKLADAFFSFIISISIKKSI